MSDSLEEIRAGTAELARELSMRTIDLLRKAFDCTEEELKTMNLALAVCETTLDEFDKSRERIQ